MKENSIRKSRKENPVLLDRVLQNLQDVLLDNLPWLDFAFGKAHKLVEHRIDGRKFLYPAAYNGNGEYVSLLPNDNLGNFAWFDIYDPQKINTKVAGLPSFSFEGALIFWYNLKDIFEDETVLYTEEIKDEVLRLLMTPGIISSVGSITITSVYERFENIYKDYSIERIYNNYAYKGENMGDIDRQFFMFPYTGLRVEFNLTTRELCRK